MLQVTHHIHRGWEGWGGVSEHAALPSPARISPTHHQEGCSRGTFPTSFQPVQRRCHGHYGESLKSGVFPLHIPGDTARSIRKGVKAEGELLNRLLSRAEAAMGP